jgi:hypothetical protein
VWWELEQAFATVHPERILLFLQRITRARYEALAESIQARFGIALPQFEPSRFRRTASGFIEFGEGWRTRFLPLRAPFWRVSPRKKPRRLFHQALQPVFSRLGVDWRPLPISVLKVVLVALLLGSAVYTGIDFNNAVDRLMYIPAGGVRVEVPRSVAGLWLSAPGMLEPIKPRDFQERWEHLRPVAEKLESYESNTAPILVEVERVIFKPEVQLQRTEVVARALLDMKAREEGVSHFQSSTRETRVSGHPALRVSMRYTVDDQPWRLEALFLAIGQSAWSVRAVMMDSPGADVSVRRIFDSVGLAEDVADEHP